MPWPLLIWIGAGIAALIGGVAAYAVWSEEQEAREKSAREEARKMASREQEKEILERKMKIGEKVKKLSEQYGKNVPKEKATALMNDVADTLGALRGNREGLEAKGESSSSEADEAERILGELSAKAMKK